MYNMTNTLSSQHVSDCSVGVYPYSSGFRTNINIETSNMKDQSKETREQLKLGRLPKPTGYSSQKMEQLKKF